MSYELLYTESFQEVPFFAMHADQSTGLSHSFQLPAVYPVLCFMSAVVPLVAESAVISSAGSGLFSIASQELDEEPSSLPSLAFAAPPTAP